VLDASLLFASMVVIKNYYAQTQHKIYDAALVVPAFASYIAIWMFSVWIGGGYDRPFKPLRTIRSIAVGSAVILIAYSLLPEHLRFSRALLLLAVVDAVIVFVLTRTLWNIWTRRTSGWFDKTEGNVVIVGSEAEVERVKQMLERIQRTTIHVLGIHPDQQNAGGHEHVLSNLEEIIRVHEIDQIIYCARDMSSSEIIASMSEVNDKRVEFKIAPPESLYIIGSGSIESAGDGSMMDVNSVQLLTNRRKKRILDILIALSALLLAPLLLFFQKQPLRLLPNIFRVLLGRVSWVGYASAELERTQLPKIKSGVLATTRSDDPIHQRKMDVLYAKDYRVTNDLRIIWTNLANMGS
jgi:FlaA1/EpsC-like NDP-sugar epimerase